uniref:Uncharacterized protein n=1 Tax=Anguilla anguilla TaxID=7936 RepID=A0A0E9PW08_ANGAN
MIKMKGKASRASAPQLRPQGSLITTAGEEGEMEAARSSSAAGETH